MRKVMIRDNIIIHRDFRNQPSQKLLIILELTLKILIILQDQNRTFRKIFRFMSQNRK
jgi:hypothetical protein